MNNERNIKLSPAMMQYFADEFYMLMLLMSGMLMSGYEDELVKLCCLLLCAFLFIYLLGRLWFYKSVKWEITRSQIKITHGVLRRSVNYVELYRVIDYAEEQTFIQQMLGLKDVYILSSDRTEPSLRIFGIPNEIDIINQIKPLVKQARIDNHIYEIANN